MVLIVVLILSECVLKIVKGLLQNLMVDCSIGHKRFGFLSLRLLLCVFLFNSLLPVILRPLGHYLAFRHVRRESVVEPLGLEKLTGVGGAATA